MRSLTKFLVFCLAGTVLAVPPAQSQNAFQASLDDFEQALTRHRQAIGQHDMEMTFNATVDKALQNKAADSPEFRTFSTMKIVVTTIDNKEIVDKAMVVALMLAAGENGVWTGSSIATIDADWDKNTSVWSSDYVRTGFDKVRPYMEWLGTGLVGASLVLNANGATGITTQKRGTALGGAGVLLLGSVLQKYLGAKSTNEAAGKVGAYELNLAQIMALRANISESAP